MGLFTSRPEEPTEWAGLPSEPLEVPDAERIGDASTSAASLSLLGGGAVESILVPISVVVEIPTAAATTGEDGPDPEEAQAK